MSAVIFHRTALLVGKATMDRLAALRVAVFGVGGVGSFAAEALVRSGVGHLMLVDSDDICSTNVNRQIQATSRNIGAPKVEALKRRLLDIHPQADIEARQAAFNERTAGQFALASFDYVLDAIDSLKNKVLLLEHCLDAGVAVYASMGAAAKLDGTQVRVARLSKTKICPLARMVRKRLNQRGRKGADCLCVYSEEPPLAPAQAGICGSGQCACSHGKTRAADVDADNPDWCALKSQVNGTAVHVTGAFGLALAGLVIQDVRNRLPPTPLRSECHDP
jgi:tRNA A37 threonylcarbamoyladenosine dehydratase